MSLEPLGASRGPAAHLVRLGTSMREAPAAIIVVRTYSTYIRWQRPAVGFSAKAHTKIFVINLELAAATKSNVYLPAEGPKS